MNAHFLKTTFHTSVPGRALLAVVAVSALLLAVGWLLRPSGQAQAQSGELTISFTATIDPWATTTDDVALTSMTLSEGMSIAPEFQTSTYSYTLTVPPGTRQLGFTGRFTSPPHDNRGKGFGLLAAGTKDELDYRIHHSNVWVRNLAWVATDQRFARVVKSALAPPGSNTTMEIRVYKKLPGQAFKLPAHDPQISVWKIYTLAVTRELPDNDVATLYDLTISRGSLSFDPDTTSYTVYVARDVESVVLTPTTLHPMATPTVNGADPSTAVSLDEGENVIPIVVTAADGMATQTYRVTVNRGGTTDYSALIAQMYQWRDNDPQWSSVKAHTDRWDRALLAFGETVADGSITPMTADEAQALADQDWGVRWVPVAAALRELEAARQPPQQSPQQQGQESADFSRVDSIPGDPLNRAPTVAVAPVGCERPGGGSDAGGVAVGRVRRRGRTTTR